MATNAYFTYNTLLTPAHPDIEVLLDAICQVIPDTDRVAVHAQTINVRDITPKEASRINALDPAVADDANVLRTTIYAKGEPTNIHL
jgi:hypothetical protein